MRRSSRRRGLVIASAVPFLCLALLACAAPAPPVAAAPDVVEDDAPRVWGATELDVPARPLGPIEPVYPKRLREIGAEGSVEARLVVRPDGRLQRAELVASDHPEFTRAVREALRGARFTPGLRDGQPVASALTLRFHFGLDR